MKKYFTKPLTHLSQLIWISVGKVCMYVTFKAWEIAQWVDICLVSGKPRFDPWHLIWSAEHCQKWFLRGGPGETPGCDPKNNKDVSLKDKSRWFWCADKMLGTTLPSYLILCFTPCRKIPKHCGKVCLQK